MTKKPSEDMEALASRALQEKMNPYDIWSKHGGIGIIERLITERRSLAACVVSLSEHTEGENE